MDVAVAGIKGIDASGLKVEKWTRDPALRENKYVVKSIPSPNGCEVRRLNSV
jgi:hypothetical protein